MIKAITFLLMIFKINMGISQETAYYPKATFTYEETSINYEIIGEGNINVIFLHGFGMSLNAWNDIKYMFPASKYKLFLLDLKGSGFSTKGSDGDYSLEKQVKILIAFIQLKQLNNISFISHSYGGLVTLYFVYYSMANHLKINIESMVLLDTPTYPDSTPFFIKVLKNPILRFISQDILPVKFNAKYIINSTFYNKREAKIRLLDRYMFFMKLKGYNEAVVQLAKQLMPQNQNQIIESYKNIKIPTLILWGEEDTLISIKSGEKLHKDLKNSIFIKVPKCGHVPHEELPSITFNHIINFFENH